MTGLLIESTVAILLVITIAYCFVLDRRLRRLRSGEHALRAGIAELRAATETAERAIAGLKITVGDCDRTLGERLRAAERLSADIDRQLTAGEVMLRRMVPNGAASSAHTAQPSPSSAARNALAAALAFADRSRARGRDATA